MDRVSASKITSYLMCPMKFKFHYVDRIPPAFKNSGLAFGSAVHSALNWFHDALLAGEKPDPQQVLRIFRADWTAQRVENLNYKRGENGEQLQTLGEQLISIYCQESQGIEVQASEKRFEVPLIDPQTGECLGPDLIGYLDLVLADDVLLELKTAARSYTKDTLARNIQFSAYAFAYRQIYQRDPKVKVVALLKQKKPRIETYAVERPPSSDRWFVYLAASVAQAIDSQAFHPCPGWQCGDCEYAEHCQHWFDIESHQQSTAVSPAVNF